MRARIHARLPTNAAACPIACTGAAWPPARGRYHRVHTQLAAELGKCSDVRFALEPIDEHDIGPNVRKRAHLPARSCKCTGRVPSV